MPVVYTKDNQIVSREKAIAKLKEEIKSFEEIFETKFLIVSKSKE